MATQDVEKQVGEEKVGAQQANVFAHLQMAPVDPIFGTKTAYLRDVSDKKINLGIGAYRTDEGKPYVLQAVHQAEKEMVEDPKLDHEYLPIDGHEGFRKAAAELLYGRDSAALKDKRVAVVQTLSGTGALRIGADFVAKYFPQAAIYYSDPTWGNHNSIFAAARVQAVPYTYWNDKERKLDLDAMLSTLRAAPVRSVVLLHGCAHNPTGVDPTMDQWKAIAAVCQERQHLPFFDVAYQGFATGDVDNDAWALRYFVQLGFSVLCSQSFAKNMGMYNERVGTFSVVCEDAKTAEIVNSQLNMIIRPMYSNPPAHGALVVHRVLTEPKLRELWLKEMQDMSSRIDSMRKALYAELTKLETPGDWTHIKTQIGMFSYTGLTELQCEHMIADHHVHMLKNGRISMAGVNSKNVQHLAFAIDDVVRKFQ